MHRQHSQQSTGQGAPPARKRSDEGESLQVSGNGLSPSRASDFLSRDGSGWASSATIPPPKQRLSLWTRFRKSELAAGASYCTMSTAMVLLNKSALSSFHFECPNALLLFQCVLACVLVKVCELLGLVGPVERLSWRVAKVWLPANILFVAMIWSSFFALKHLNVAMVTVLKNLTNLITITGDIIINKKRYPAGVWLTLALMIVSALAGASTDLTFNLEGYLWQILNCFMTAAYSLYLRTVMDEVKVLCSKTGGFGEPSMVFYNNVLSLPFVTVLMLAFDEHHILFRQQALQIWDFQIAALLSGLVGFGISFCSLWFLSTTTATTYSLTGSLNKIPIAMIGLVAFDAKPTYNNTVSVLIGLAAGVVFGYVKARPQGEPKEAPPLPVTQPSDHKK